MDNEQANMDCSGLCDTLGGGVICVELKIEGKDERTPGLLSLRLGRKFAENP